ncbi:hypothetical protein VTK26DRAFT_7110 [Humicola hyalothermophila]
MLPLIFAATLIVPAAATSSSEARPLLARGNGIIRAPVRAVPAPIPAPKSLNSRQEVLDLVHHSNGSRYTIEVGIGTPPQDITLILDTGSPDTWVNPTCATAEFVESYRDCQAFPQYDYTRSSSVNITEYAEVLRYGRGNATVQYVGETLTFGSASITNQLIGVAIESHQIPLGILGLSPPVNSRADYPFVLDTMVDQGVIESRAFSLDLRSIDNPNGAIIFGGVDTGKYIGELAKLPMLDPLDSPGGANRYYVTMTGVGLTLPNGEVARSGAIDVPVFLDSGGTLSQLPRNIFQAFAAAFDGAEYDPDQGYYFVPCDVTDLRGSVDFYFGDDDDDNDGGGGTSSSSSSSSKVIRVPFNDFVWQIEGYCILGVVESDGEAVLGDTFLRAAYVVFDQDNRNLHIAQAANCGENLVAIGRGPDAVPSSTGDCTALPTPTGGRGDLDVTATRAPPGTYKGSGPTGVALGPGPAASKEGGDGAVVGTGLPQPTGKTGDEENAAGRGVAGVGFAAVVAWGMVNLMTWVML